jgi:uncharacterized protein YbbC (DUF1343 family)
MILTGLDRLLADDKALAGRRYGLLVHGASVSAALVPAHVALKAAGAEAPTLLLGPEHGLYGIEQDMVPSADQVDPWTGLRVVSLYGDTESSLRADRSHFRDLDLLVIDLQDVGARYYTYAATAVWTAEVALQEGCEVWVLDRPNPIGGLVVEGNLRQEGYESFVGAFQTPVRHSLTLGELMCLEAARRSWPEGLRVWTLQGWHRSMLWQEIDRLWIAPSPNIPTPQTALVYPGLCLVEGTELSEGRGTTRPFELIGAPGIDALRLAGELNSRGLAGVRFVPTFFRPVFHKHENEICGGVEIKVTDPWSFQPYRCGVEVLYHIRRIAPEAFAWREQAYEFVSDRPAIDLLTGSSELREVLESEQDPVDWCDSWFAQEDRFRREIEPWLLYPRAASS